jgi:hypothetical protein
MEGKPSQPIAATSPATSASATSAPPARVSACRTSQLEITLTRSGAAGPIVGGYIGFRNLAGAPCRLSGWPALVGVTATGAKLKANRLLTTMFGPDIKAPPQVTLNHGALAETVFTGNEVRGSCASGPLPTFRTLRVTPPGNVQSATISAWLAPADTYLPDCGEITISPVVPSADLRTLLYSG